MLYANGCSFTYGTGLAHKDRAWPYILAEKLKIDSVETEAQRGVSNAYIVRNTITNLSVKIAEGEKIDFVAIGMTAPNRKEHFIEKKNLLILKLLAILCQKKDLSILMIWMTGC